MHCRQHTKDAFRGEGQLWGSYIEMNSTFCLYVSFYPYKRKLEWNFLTWSGFYCMKLNRLKYCQIAIGVSPLDVRSERIRVISTWCFQYFPLFLIFVAQHIFLNCFTTLNRCFHVLSPLMASFLLSYWPHPCILSSKGVTFLSADHCVLQPNSCMFGTVVRSLLEC